MIFFSGEAPVMRFVNAIRVAAACVVAGSPPPLLAQPPAADAVRISACSLVPKEEVKRYLPWSSVLDNMPIEEEPIGAVGSSCNYPTVFVQVMPFSQGTFDAARRQGGLEAISGVGDEAYFRNNADRYAELYVKSGKQLLTLQANLEDDMESVKPGVLNLAKVLVAKLP